MGFIIKYYRVPTLCKVPQNWIIQVFYLYNVADSAEIISLKQACPYYITGRFHINEKSKCNNVFISTIFVLWMYLMFVSPAAM